MRDRSAAHPWVRSPTWRKSHRAERSERDAGASSSHSSSKVALAVRARCVSGSLLAEGKEGTPQRCRVPSRRGRGRA
jgi:hypothetical protein